MSSEDKELSKIILNGQQENWPPENTLNNDQITQVLVNTLLPSLAKEMRLQALVVYQVDGDCNKSFIINRCFTRANEIGLNEYSSEITEKKECTTPSNHNFNNDKAILETSLINDSSGECNNDVSNVRTEDTRLTSSVSFKFAPSLSLSRRKRKFCRPCKIPQLTNLNDFPTMDTGIQKESVGKKIKQELLPLKNDNLNSLPLPVNLFDQSASTIVGSFKALPHISSSALNSGFSPRPIRPKILPNTLKNGNLAKMTLNVLSDIPIYGSGHQTGRNFDTADGNEDTWSSSRRYAKSFACNQCRSVFNSLNGLCEHTYSLHKAFRCTFCGAQFTQRSNLQRHSLRHVGFKPFVCSVCSKEYYRKDHLVRHIEVTHPGTEAKSSIIVKLSSAECLDFLENLNNQGLKDASAVNNFSELSSLGDSNLTKKNPITTLEQL